MITGGFACCGSIVSGLNLDILAKHNKIEHDASLVHDDAAPGAEFAPTEVDQALLKKLVDPHPNGLTLEDFAQARVDRQAVSNSIDPIHAEIAHGEVAMTFLLMQNSHGVVPAQTLVQWYGEERFPDMYVRPAQEVTLMGAKAVGDKVGAAMKILTAKGTNNVGALAAKAKTEAAPTRKLGGVLKATPK